MQKIQNLSTGVLDAITACLQASDFESGSLGMEYLVEMVELSPKFFRPNIMMLMELMFKITSSDQLEDSIRQLAVETMITLSETKPGMVRKIPNFMEGIVGLLLEWGTRLEENEDWNKGEEEDLDDVDAAVAEESLDRLSIALGGATLVPTLFSAVPAFLSSDNWQKRYSGLIAISVSGEGSALYLMQHLDKVVAMVLPFCKDAHPRVRWAACNAIGQMCTDFQPHIQVGYANDILSALIPVFDDKENPRVQSHAASAIVNFCEECSEELIAPFLKPILEKLHSLLQSPKIVQEQVITAVAALADAGKEQFRPFYGYFMPFLKDVLNTAVSKEYLLLRCKAMECASIIGVAVGKEIFGQDAQEIIDLLNKIEIASDPEMPSMHMAWARLCKCLGTDFKPYLDMAMPKLLELASIQPEVQIVDTDRIEEFTEGWEVLPLGDSVMCIKTSEAEDKSTAVNIIFCFADEMGEHFFPYVQPVAQLMANCLTFPYHDAVRNTAGSCCPCLLTSTIAHLTQTGQGMQPAVELWNFLQPHLLKAIRKEVDVEAHVSMLEGYSECVDLVGETSHTPESLKDAHNCLYKVLQKYLNARANRSKSKGEGEEDFDEYEAEKLENLTERDDDVIALIAEMTGKLFKLYKANYLPIFQDSSKVWKQFLKPECRTRDTQMALCIFDDMAEYLGEAVTPHVSDLFNIYGSLCANDNSDVRQATVYGLGMFAQNCGQAFGSLANSAANALCQMIAAENSRAPESVHATENAISALGKICLYQKDAINLAKFVSAFVSFLPVCEDKEESKVTYTSLCLLLERDTQLVLGADFAQVPHVLHLFGGILWTELVDDATMEKVVASIKRLESVNQKMFQEACGVISEEERGFFFLPFLFFFSFFFFFFFSFSSLHFISFHSLSFSQKKSSALAICKQTTTKILNPVLNPVQ